MTKSPATSILPNTRDALLPYLSPLTVTYPVKHSCLVITFVYHVGETKTHQMRISQVFRANYSKGGSHHNLCLAKSQRQAEERGSFGMETREAGSGES